MKNLWVSSKQEKIASRYFPKLRYLTHYMLNYSSSTTILIRLNQGIGSMHFGISTRKTLWEQII